MHICVLGAGVVGVTTAYQLLQAGHEVSLVDEQADAGRMTSYGNGAQLSYSYVAPLADPSVWRKWPHYLFSADSPLTLRPQLDTAQWRWLWQFLSASNAAQVKQTTIDLLQLAFFSRDQLASIQARHALNFCHEISGKLVMFSDQASLDAARAQVEFQAAYGCQQQVLNARQCLELEPALAEAKRSWTGGVYTPSEEAGDCAAFCSGLLEKMRLSPRFCFLGGTRIDQSEVNSNALKAVFSAGKRIAADAYVLAMGVGSAAFARRLGFSLPVYPLKGYSLSIPLQATESAYAPKVSITDTARKIVYARLGSMLRVAGRVEIVGMDASIPARASRELIQGTLELFPRCGDLSDVSRLSPWAGFRPATPKGLPIIGRSPLDNLYLNTGHGALGWTLACGSAALLTELVNGGKPSINPLPYSLGQ
jgi:D-amino-acid dehydrogenase